MTEDYFRALGVPLLRGRFFDANDDSGTVRVTIVSERMAERYWPGEDPIGKRVRATSMEPMKPEWLTVVGVVGDVRHWGLESEPVPEHFVLHRQRPDFSRGMTIVVRGRADPDAVPALVGAVRQRIRAQDPSVPVEMGTLAQRLDRSLAERRFSMSVLGGFGAVALLMAAVGVYGVFSFSVARRRREMAVRMALGAERGKVVGLVLGGALRVAVAGAAIGVVGALALTRLMESMLFGVKPTDPPTFVAVSALLLAVAALAAWVPARRASRVDPMEALRGE